VAKKKKSSKPSKGGLQHISPGSLPDMRTMEQLLHQLMMGLDNAGPVADSPLDRAQNLVFDAMGGSPAKRAKLARQALEISPDCADAYVLLADGAKTAEEAVELYQQGVEAGERALGQKTFKQHKGHFWGIIETRPYMRARESLAQCLWAMGRHEEAVEHYRGILDLNPNDNQGVRYSLATLLLDLDRHEELDELLIRYEDDSSAEWAYSKTLAAFRKSGDSAEANRLLKKAIKVNKHVPDYLLGHKQLPRDLPEYVSRGGEDEAVGYTAGNRRVWLNTPGAVSWLRKISGVSLPPPPKPRQPSWPQVRLSLRACPQEDEIWQVDAIPSPLAEEGDADDETPWLVLIVGRDSREMLSCEPFMFKPSPAELLNHVADVMRTPQDGYPRRPFQIEVRQKAFHTAWKAKLKQIDVECVLTDELSTIDEAIGNMTSPEALARVNDSMEPINPEELLELPAEPGEVWQAAICPMPIWLPGDGEPSRPWVAMVVSSSNNLVLCCKTFPECPPAESLWEAIAQAASNPIVGKAHRPASVEVDSEELRQALMQSMERGGIECVAVPQLERIDAAMESMAKHMTGGEGPPSLMASPGVQPEQIGAFYAAAAEYYRRKPWRTVPGDTIIKAECDRFTSGPWYAVVMGQSGVQQGLAIYEDLAALRKQMTGRFSDEEGAREMSAISLMFSEAFDIACRDYDAAKKHGWPVAGPEAHPLVLRVNPGCAIRPPLAWEIELLEACLKSIPDFLIEKTDVASKTVSTVSGPTTLRLSWVCSH
jgi:tetratricopeptide (TPR) repeat protein